ncbi:hypothetical protein BGZ95_005641 [Linnemannia exigua]|uniref:Uncharacterized protein n=1 Tax=Linnemannia exigua TaxID=604196 RepID=A0AAD4H132_9FUNG|nr:hypothetical protein BGZ95_005641 [Linnemannia exigua]
MPPRPRARSYAAVVAQWPLPSSTKQKQNIVALKKGNPITEANPTTKPPKPNHQRLDLKSQITKPPAATVNPTTIISSTIKSSTTKSPTTMSPAIKVPVFKSVAISLAKVPEAPLMSKRKSRTPNNSDPDSSKAVTNKNSSAKKPTTRKRSTIHSETDESDLEPAKKPAKKKAQRYQGPSGSTVRRLGMHQKEQNIMNSTIPKGMTEEQYKNAIKTSANKVLLDLQD